MQEKSKKTATEVTVSLFHQRLEYFPVWRKSVSRVACFSAVIQIHIAA